MAPPTALSFIMDSDEEAALLVILLRRRLRRRQRKFWMNPLTSGRLTDGQFNTIMSILRADDDKFLSYFGMSQNSFDHLLSLIKPHITKADTNMRRSIPPEERLAITLRYVSVFELLLKYPKLCVTIHLFDAVVIPF